MPRLPRIVIPGLPHHITQRGNRRQTTFFEDIDYQVYLQCMRQACIQFDVKIWAYCLMPNHTHLIVVPSTTSSLAPAIGGGHEAYTRYINFKMKWKGHFWQGRFSSFPMDEVHLHHGFAYVELNPVTAKMVQNPEDHPWSSARAHMGLADDHYLDDVEKIKNIVDDWKVYLTEKAEINALKAIEKHERSGRPLGSRDFIKDLELKLGIELLPRKPGRKPKSK